MNIIYLQTILLLFALLMIYSLYLHWKRKEITNRIFIFWIILFVVFLFINFFPKALESLIVELFTVRVMDLAMIGTFMILTYITIENNIKIKKLEKTIEKLVRKISIKNILKR